jgi:Protein of unknown function (DUF2934)
MSSAKNHRKPSARKQTPAPRPSPALPHATARAAQPAPRPTQQVEAKPAMPATAPTATSAAPTPQAIAEAAYYLWLQRGGSQVDNWLEAEANLRSRTTLAGVRK